MELFGDNKNQRYFGKMGLAQYMHNTHGIEFEGTHEQKLMFPNEEEPFQKLAFVTG